MNTRNIRHPVPAPSFRTNPVRPKLAETPGTPPTTATLAAMWIVAIYLFSKMFYVGRSGTAQPADIMLCALAFFIVPPREMLALLRNQIALPVMVIWVAIVNLVWFMLTSEVSFLPPILYFVFNLLIVITFFGVRERDRALFDKVICRAIIVAVIVQTLFVLVERITHSGLLRNVGTFKNPNQLAYWGVLMLSLFLMLRRNQLGRGDILFMGAAIFCEFASASRAGLAALVALLVMWLYCALGDVRKRVFACVAVTAVGILLALTPAMDRVLVTGAEGSAVGSRLTEQNEISQFDERQYNRIIEFYQYTLAGAGEGYLSRFVSENQFKLEIHSSFGTMLFSYGVPGLTLFVALVAGIFRRLPTRLGIYLIPSLVYGITHQGLRFTLFWALIGVAASVSQDYRRAVAQPLARLPRKRREARGPEALRHSAPPTGPNRFSRRYGQAPAPSLQAAQNRLGQAARRAGSSMLQQQRRSTDKRSLAHR